MLENEIATQLINEGGLATNGEFVYLPLRLTGTGITERLDNEGLAYVIDRQLEIFATEDWLKQYANIPVLLTHPKNESGENVRADLENGLFVGNTIASYIKEKEIWVIARIFHKETIELIMQRTSEKLPISTSPHFVSENQTQEGSEVFLEIPKKINHLAIVEKGFWDKKSLEPSIDVGNGEILNLDKGDDIVHDTEKNDTIMQREVNSSDDSKELGLEDRVATLEKQIESLVNVEAKEGEELEKVAKEHENLSDKGDSNMAEEFKITKDVLKKVVINDLLQEANWADNTEHKEAIILELAKIIEASGGSGDGIETKDDNANEDTLNLDTKEDSEKEEKPDAKEDIESKEKTDDSDTKEKEVKEEAKESDKSDDIITGDFCDEDRERGDLIQKMHSFSDIAKTPFIEGRFKTHKVIQMFAKSNLDLVDEKYHGLLEKIDSRDSKLAKDIFDSMVQKIEAKRSENLKNANTTNETSFFSGKFKNK